MDDDYIPEFAKPLPSDPQAPPNNNDDYRSNNTEAPQLPMWAVILIIVFLLALFVSIVCLYFYCKRKYKKRKMKKNRILLHGTSPAYYPSPQNPSLWEDGWQKEDYQEDGTIKSGYLPGSENAWIQNNLKNATYKSQIKELSVKNLNILHNETETLKRKAPAPPPPDDQTYENLPCHNEKTKTQRRAPPPPPPMDDSEDNKTVLTNTASLKNIPAIMKEAQHSTVKPHTLPSSPPIRPPKSQSVVMASRNETRSTTTFATHSAVAVEIDDVEDEDNDDDSDDRSESSEEAVSVAETEKMAVTEESANEQDDFQKVDEEENGLMGILAQWKEHLFAQKSELQDYYNKLTGYVESLVIQPTDSVSNVGMEELQKYPAEGPPHNTEKRKSLKKARRSRLPSYPAPPESVMDEWTFDPSDVQGQKKIINDLKTRLSELENLLQNTKELADEGDEMPVQENRKKTRSMRRRRQPAQTASRTLPTHSHQQKTSNSHHRSTKTLPTKKIERISIQKLLAQLDREDGERLVKKIDKILQASKQQTNMKMNENKGHMTSLQLARQIHHVMRDVINPRLRTNLLLATQAATNLTSKLAKVLYSEDKSKLGENKDEASTLTDRLTGLVRHMLDMSRQLELRIDSYYKEDFSRFIDAFLLIAMKIMSVTHQFVMLGGKVQVEEASKPSRVQSLRSSNIRNHLIHKDVVQLSDGLTKLEVLLKSGKLPGFESSAPPSGFQTNSHSLNYTGAESSESCDSDCESYSYTSCSTCFPPRNDLESTQRNPYLFPGDSTAKTLPQRIPNTSVDDIGKGYGNTRPPTRPNTMLRTEGRKSCPKPQSPEELAYMDQKHKATSRPENIFYYPEVTNEVENGNHEVMLAKYLNELLKTQSDKTAVSLPYSRNLSRENKSKNQSLNPKQQNIEKKDKRPSSKASKQKQKNSKAKNKKSGKNDRKILTKNEKTNKSEPTTDKNLDDNNKLKPPNDKQTDHKSKLNDVENSANDEKPYTKNDPGDKVELKPANDVEPDNHDLLHNKADHELENGNPNIHITPDDEEKPEPTNDEKQEDKKVKDNKNEPKLANTEEPENKNEAKSAQDEGRYNKDKPELPNHKQQDEQNDKDEPELNTEEPDNRDKPDGKDESFNDKAPDNNLEQPGSANVIQPNDKELPGLDNDQDINDSLGETEAAIVEEPVANLNDSASANDKILDDKDKLLNNEELDDKNGPDSFHDEEPDVNLSEPESVKDQGANHTDGPDPADDEELDDNVEKTDDKNIPDDRYKSDDKNEEQHEKDNAEPANDEEPDVKINEPTLVVDKQPDSNGEPEPDDKDESKPVDDEADNKNEPEVATDESNSKDEPQPANDEEPDVNSHESEPTYNKQPRNNDVPEPDDKDESKPANDEKLDNKNEPEVANDKPNDQDELEINDGEEPDNKEKPNDTYDSKSKNEPDKKYEPELANYEESEDNFDEPKSTSDVESHDKDEPKPDNKNKLASVDEEPKDKDELEPANFKEQDDSNQPRPANDEKPEDEDEPNDQDESDGKSKRDNKNKPQQVDDEVPNN